MGHEVLLVGNGREVVEAARKSSFDLIVMDVQMPVMDGFQATSAVRNEERRLGRESVPIIAMTAHAMGGDRENVLIRRVG